ncbi:MAG: hypothetical protein R3B65_00340 [Candidatus Paceibacterota bacterium]
MKKILVTLLRAVFGLTLIAAMVFGLIFGLNFYADWLDTNADKDFAAGYFIFVTLLGTALISLVVRRVVKSMSASIDGG